LGLCCSKNSAKKNLSESGGTQQAAGQKESWGQGATCEPEPLPEDYFQAFPGQTNSREEFTCAARHSTATSATLAATYPGTIFPFPPQGSAASQEERIRHGYSVPPPVIPAEAEGDDDEEEGPRVPVNIDACVPEPEPEPEPEVEEDDLVTTSPVSQNASMPDRASAGGAAAASVTAAVLCAAMAL